MLSSQIPLRFPIPFANNAALAFIRQVPTASQIGVQDGAASLTDGFVPDNFTNIASGGVPPFGQDMNGLLKQITQWCQWQAAGGLITWDSDFATAISGYPQGAMLDSVTVLGAVWMSTVNGNVTDPDSLSAANWVRAPGSPPIGTPLALMSPTVPTGYVAANGLSIGNASSNATNRADGSTWPLFNYHWLGFSNSQCPLFTSAGALVARGANPAADYAANRAITVLDMRGCGIIGVDTMGGNTSNRLAGVPINSGNTTTPGSVFGENTHQLTVNELAQHLHANTTVDSGHAHGTVDPGHIHGQTLLNGTQGLSTSGGTEGWGAGGFAHISINNGFSINSSVTGITVSSNVTGVTVSNANAGGNLGHNNVMYTMGAYWNLKL